MSDYLRDVLGAEKPIEKPAQPQGLVADAGPDIPGGEGANEGFWRRQIRDAKGRWAKMFGNVTFDVDLPSYGNVKGHGKLVRISRPGVGVIKVKNHSTLPDGEYEVPSERFTKAGAIISDKDFERVTGKSLGQSKPKARIPDADYKRSTGEEPVAQIYPLPDITADPSIAWYVDSDNMPIPANKLTPEDMVPENLRVRDKENNRILDGNGREVKFKFENRESADPRVQEVRHERGFIDKNEISEEDVIRDVKDSQELYELMYDGEVVQAAPEVAWNAFRIAADFNDYIGKDDNAIGKDSPIVKEVLDSLDALPAKQKAKILRAVKPSDLNEEKARRLIDFVKNKNGEALTQDEMRSVHRQFRNLGVDLTNLQMGDSTNYTQNNLGAPRGLMPQLGEAADAELFRKYCADNGIEVTDELKTPDQLTPIQSEMDMGKVGGIAQGFLNPESREKLRRLPIYVTRDGYVIDGHHRWAAALIAQDELGEDIELNTVVLDIDHGEGIRLANEFTDFAGIKKADLSQKLEEKPTPKPEVAGEVGMKANPSKASPLKDPPEKPDKKPIYKIPDVGDETDTDGKPLQWYVDKDGVIVPADKLTSVDKTKANRRIRDIQNNRVLDGYGRVVEFVPEFKDEASPTAPTRHEGGFWDLNEIDPDEVRTDITDPQEAYEALYDMEFVEVDKDVWVEALRIAAEDRPFIGADENAIGASELADEVTQAFKKLSNRQYQRLRRAISPASLNEKRANELLDFLNSKKGQELTADEMKTLARTYRTNGVDVTNMRMRGQSNYTNNNLGAERGLMPQLGTEADQKQFEAILDELGIKYSREKRTPDQLSPVQSEMDMGNVGNIAKSFLDPELRKKYKMDEQVLYVTRDGYVIDGHHRWAGALAAQEMGDKPVELNVVVVDLDHEEALKLANEYNDYIGVTRQTLGATSSKPKPAPKRKVEGQVGRKGNPPEGEGPTAPASEAPPGPAAPTPPPKGPEVEEPTQATELKDEVSGDEALKTIRSVVAKSLKEEGRFPVIRSDADIEKVVSEQYKGFFDQIKQEDPELLKVFGKDIPDADLFWEYLKSNYGTDLMTRYVAPKDLPPLMKRVNQLYAEKFLGVKKDGLISFYRNNIREKDTEADAAAGYASLDRYMAFDYNVDRGKYERGRNTGRYEIKAKPDEINGLLGFSRIGDEIGAVISPEVTSIPGRVTRLGDLEIPDPDNAPWFDLKNFADFDRSTGGSPFRQHRPLGQFDYYGLDKDPFGGGEDWASFYEAHGLEKGSLPAKYDELYGEGAWERDWERYRPSAKYFKALFKQYTDKDGKKKWGLQGQYLWNMGSTETDYSNPKANDGLDKHLKFLSTMQELIGKPFFVSRGHDPNDPRLADVEKPEFEAPATPEVETKEKPLDFSKFNKTSGPLGSNPGGIYENPSTGEKYYVKIQDKERGDNEALASALYEEAGINALKVKKGAINGQPVTYTEWSEGVQKLNLDSVSPNDPVMDGFAIDAWLANWDVVGTGYDNLGIDKDGNPIRIDAGGALLYRARGARKQDAFGNEVKELETYKDKTNTAGELYSRISPEAEKRSVEKLRAITPEKIDELVDSFVSNPDDNKKLKEKLKARREYILNKYPEEVQKPTSDERKELLKQLFKPLTPQNFTEEQKEILKDYSSYGYRDLNTYLRLGREGAIEEFKSTNAAERADRAAKSIEEINKLFETSVSERDAVLYRLVPRDVGEGVKSGDILSDLAILSTTRNPESDNINDQFNANIFNGLERYYEDKYDRAHPNDVGWTVLEIQTPAGTRAIDMSRISEFPEEREVLLPPGSKLEVVSVVSDSGTAEQRKYTKGMFKTYKITVKVVPQEKQQTSKNSIENLGIDFQSATMDANNTRLPTPGAFTGKFQEIMRGATSWKDVQERLSAETVTYFDFETTGIADYDGQDITNDPIQLGAVQVKDGKIIKRFNVYMDPKSRLSEWSANTLKRDILDSKGNRILDDNGEFKQESIDSEWLSKQSSQEQALRDFIEFIGPNALLGGQNVPFDLEILKRMAEKSGIDLDIAGTIDSKDLASLLPKYDPEKGIDGPKQVDKKTGNLRPSSSLGPVANFLGFEPANWHSADGDAEDSYNLVSKIIDRAAKEDNEDLSLLDFPLMQKRYEERMAEFKQIVSPNNPITENQQKALQRMSESVIPWISQKANDAINSVSTRGQAAKALEEINAGNWKIVDGVGVKGESDILDESLSKFIFDTYNLPRSKSTSGIDVKEFTPEEKGAIRYYTGEGYKEINKYLINNMEPKSEFLDNMISKLDEIFKKYKYAKDGIVYRGMTPPDNPEDKLNYYKMLENLEPGSIVSSVSYTSTSDIPSLVAKNFAGASPYEYSDGTYGESSFNSDSGQFGGSFWAISVPKGSTAFEIPFGLDEYWFDEAEAETILPAGAKLRIKAIRRVPFGSNLKPGFATYVNDNYRYYIDAELVEEAKSEEKDITPETPATLPSTPEEFASLVQNYSVEKEVEKYEFSPENYIFSFDSEIDEDNIEDFFEEVDYNLIFEDIDDIFESSSIDMNSVAQDFANEWYRRNRERFIFPNIENIETLPLYDEDIAKFSAEKEKIINYCRYRNRLLIKEMFKEMEETLPEDDHPPIIRMLNTLESGSDYLANKIKNATPAIAISEENLLQVISKGRFLSQFESGTTGGLFSLPRRQVVENVLSGIPTNIDDSKRSIYGYLAYDLSDAPDGLVNKSSNFTDLMGASTDEYGWIKVVLKQSVKDRSTFTMQDSLEDRALQSGALGGDVTGDTVMKAGLLNSPKLIENSAFFAGGAYSSPYTELQVHGGVSVEDIEKIVINDLDYSPEDLKLVLKNIKSGLKKANLDIPVEVRSQSTAIPEPPETEQVTSEEEKSKVSEPPKSDIPFSADDVVANYINSDDGTYFRIGDTIKITNPDTGEVTEKKIETEDDAATAGATLGYFALRKETVTNALPYEDEKVMEFFIDWYQRNPNRQVFVDSIALKNKIKEDSKKLGMDSVDSDLWADATYDAIMQYAEYENLKALNDLFIELEEKYPGLSKFGRSAVKNIEAAKIFAESVKNSKVVVSVLSDYFENIIKDGRLKTQFETGTSKGSYNPIRRLQKEMSTFGVPVKTAPEDRPIYGYLAIPDNPELLKYARSPKNFRLTTTTVNHYGDLRFVLKDSAKKKTTFTMEDSLGATMKNGAKLSEDIDENTILETGLLIPPNNQDYPFESSYIESQIHNGVSLDDIEKIAIPYTNSLFSVGMREHMTKKQAEEKLEELKSIMEKNGVSIPIELVDGDIPEELLQPEPELPEEIKALKERLKKASPISYGSTPDLEKTSDETKDSEPPKSDVPFSTDDVVKDYINSDDGTYFHVGDTIKSKNPITGEVQETEIETEDDAFVAGGTLSYFANGGNVLLSDLRDFNEKQVIDFIDDWNKRNPNRRVYVDSSKLQSKILEDSKKLGMDFFGPMLPKIYKGSSVDLGDLRLFWADATYDTVMKYAGYENLKALTDALIEFEEKFPGVSKFAERAVKDREGVKIFAEDIKDSKVVVSVSSAFFRTILEDGRLKTQFETNFSKGTYDPIRRVKTELSTFGVPVDTDSKNRPIYAYLTLPDNPDRNKYISDEKNFTITSKAVNHYGDMRFVLKDSAKKKTTFTMRDSLAVEVRNGGKLSDDISEDTILQAGFLRTPRWDESPIETSYIEAQIHDGVSLNDVEKIVIPYSSSPDRTWNSNMTKEQAEQLMEQYKSLMEKKGISIPIELVDGDKATIDTTGNRLSESAKEELKPLISNYNFALNDANSKAYKKIADELGRPISFPLDKNEDKTPEGIETYEYIRSAKKFSKDIAENDEEKELLRIKNLYEEELNNDQNFKEAKKALYSNKLYKDAIDALNSELNGFSKEAIEFALMDFDRIVTRSRVRLTEQEIEDFSFTYPDFADQEINDLVYDVSVDLEESVEITNKDLKEFSESGVVSVIMPSRALEKVLNEGRLKSVHETKFSQAGSPSEDYRALRIAYESLAFDYKGDSPVEERPIYGLLRSSTHPMPLDGLTIYGGISPAQIILKSEVKTRTTISDWDSLNHFDPTTPLADPKFEASYLTRMAAVYKKATGDNFFETENFAKYGSIEAQVHGGVKLEDIEKVVFYETPSEEMRELLTSKGIIWEVSKNKPYTKERSGGLFF